ncbi:MAG: hypothetical protein NDJ89_19105 [Oligoflexia bacterium]|nr:hypothetical protein [Oligoflexia bacterium]
MGLIEETKSGKKFVFDGQSQARNFDWKTVNFIHKTLRLRVTSRSICFYQEPNPESGQKQKYKSRQPISQVMLRQLIIPVRLATSDQPPKAGANAITGQLKN